MDRSFIVAILILSFEPEGPGFKLTSTASRSKIANLKDGREGGSGSNFRLKHTFERVNFALTNEGWWQFVTNMVGPQENTSSSLCINDHAVIQKSEYKKRRHDFRDGPMSEKCVDWRRPHKRDWPTLKSLKNRWFYFGLWIWPYDVNMSID